MITSSAKISPSGKSDIVSRVSRTTSAAVVVTPCGERRGQSAAYHSLMRPTPLSSQILYVISMIYCSGVLNSGEKFCIPTETVSFWKIQEWLSVDDLTL